MTAGDAPAADAEWAAWFARKNFTTDWTSPHCATWCRVFGDRRDAVRDVLEIGAWEGRSAVFFLHLFPRATVTSVDTFAGSREHRLRLRWLTALRSAEHRFDSNVAEFGARSVKVKADSRAALTQLAAAGQRFDLVYVDGSHHSSDVYADAAMSWPLVRRGGGMIFDDYEWNVMPDPIRRPKLGIDAFLRAFEGEYRELHRGYQIIVERT